MRSVVASTALPADFLKRAAIIHIGITIVASRNIANSALLPPPYGSALRTAKLPRVAQSSPPTIKRPRKDRNPPAKSDLPSAIFES